VCAIKSQKHCENEDIWEAMHGPKTAAWRLKGKKSTLKAEKSFFICLLLLRDVYWNAVFAYSIINCEVSTVIFPELLNILSLLAYLEVSRIDVAVKYGTEFVRLMQQETRCSQIM